MPPIRLSYKYNVKTQFEFTAQSLGKKKKERKKEINYREKAIAQNIQTPSGELG